MNEYMISIDYRSGIPIYEQVVKQLEHLIAIGVLKQDEKLPSVRSLAVEIAINPNTIQKAYQHLEQKGLLYTVHGIGNFVSQNNDMVKQQKLEELKSEIAKKLHAAKNYGLTKETYDTWLFQLKEELYDCNN